MCLFCIIKYLLPIVGAVAFMGTSMADNKLIILHTNDTHSNIDPLPDHTGGILQRKAILDSVRKAEKNVITVDAGDAVQGTLYFKYFGGEVEYPLMDMSGYDIRIVGNHEFDNGMEALAKYYRKMTGTPLSANYDFSGTELEDVFNPYIIKEVNGKKIGFIGINIDPHSIISTRNIQVNFKEVIPTANEIASFLKNEKNCDIVIVVSHIGYRKVNDKTCDIELAEASKDIDAIIGGHTHTFIDPNHPEIYPSLINNADGKPVRIAQVGKVGSYIGKLTIDLDELPLTGGDKIMYEVIPVTDRFSINELDRGMMAYLEPFRTSVDSVNNVVIASCEYDLEQSRTGGLANLTADIAFQRGQEIADSIKKFDNSFPRIDMSIMNVGGIRHRMGKGDITEGQILSTYPFSNLMVIVSVKGEDIIEALRTSAKKGGEAVSGNVNVVTDVNGDLIRVVIDGNEMNPDRYYTLATIDYVAQGNDDLDSLANHTLLWEDQEEIAFPILKWIKKQTSMGLKINPDPRSRFIIKE